MTNSSANVHAADSSSIAEHPFLWKWYLSDLDKVQKNGKTVFSCFSCGGGSSMGYKLAGYDVIGCCEIDPRVMAVYQQNNHPKYPFLMDVRQFVDIPNEELPAELFSLDILDGSPPCSVFSTAGDREKAWNKEKVFREGQAKQKFDDLFFWFIKIAAKLQPRIVIAENVSGLIKGNAKGYVHEIFKALDAAGYKAQLFLLNSAYMGVPQKRERTFFIAQRKDQDFPKLTLSFNEPVIPFGLVRSEHGKLIDPKSAKATYEYLKYMLPSDKSIKDIKKRLYGKESNFNDIIYRDCDVAQTITASGQGIRACDKAWLSDQDCVNVTTFPQDYNFGDQMPKYVTGMSVPPVMMAHVALEVYNQWLKG
jgi:DNA (cytosine-5)-methyltransferase 1